VTRRRLKNCRTPKHASGKVTVVHNGIIENYAEIRKDLEADGWIFQSETDTEAVVGLCDRFLRLRSSPKDAVCQTLNKLEGAYPQGRLCHRAAAWGACRVKGHNRHARYAHATRYAVNPSVNWGQRPGQRGRRHRCPRHGEKWQRSLPFLLDSLSFHANGKDPCLLMSSCLI
jgi:hypothetical protein